MKKEENEEGHRAAASISNRGKRVECAFCEDVAERNGDEARALIEEFTGNMGRYLKNIEQTIISVIEHRYEVSEAVISNFSDILKKSKMLTEELEKKGMDTLKNNFNLYTKRSVVNELAFKVAEMCVRLCLKSSVPGKSLLASIPRPGVLEIVRVMKEFMPIECI